MWGWSDYLSPLKGSRLRSLLRKFLPLFFLSSVVLGQMEFREALALKIREPIEVDGDLSEPAWKRAPDASSLIQFKPEKDKRDPFSTTIKILYDHAFLYLGFRCFDPQPDKIEARVSERDKDLRNDDSVYVLIDTGPDQDHFLYFGLNLLGARLDGRVSLDGQNADVAWDGSWRAASQRTDFGWSAEMAIGLTSLQLESGEDATLGLSFARIVARQPASIFWEGPLDPAFKVSLLGQMARVELLQMVRRVKIVPHVIASAEEKSKRWAEWGLDVPFALSQMASGHLTLNPDFMTVESDEERINLTRFELFLPEKRGFFRDDSDIYDQEIRLFYSKRIPSIYGGSRFGARSGEFAFSAMSVQARKDAVTGDESSNFSVVRFRQSLGKDSSVGLLASNKLTEGKNSGAAGIDAVLHITPHFSLSGQFAASYGDHAEENTAFFIRPSYDTHDFHFHVGYFLLGKNFADNVSRVGFVPDDNRRELDSGLMQRFFIHNGSLRQVRYDSHFNVYWGMEGALRSWQVDQGVSLEMRNRFSVWAFHSREFKAMDGVLFEEDFRNHLTKVGIGFNTEEWDYASFCYSFGRNFGEGFDMLEVGKNLRFTRELDVEFTMARIFFYGLSPRNQFVHALRATYNFSRNVVARIFFQTNTMIKKLNFESLLNVRLLPPSGFVQIGYQTGRGRFGMEDTQGHTFILKFHYTF